MFAQEDSKHEATYRRKEHIYKMWKIFHHESIEMSELLMDSCIEMLDDINFRKGEYCL